MAEKTKTISFLRCLIFFQDIEKIEERKVVYDQLCQLVEKNQNSFSVKLKFIKRKDTITLDSDDFMLTIYVKKPISLRILVNIPETNLEIVNKIAANLINSLNVVLGFAAKKSTVCLSKTIYLEHTDNLARKVVGLDRLSKINEIVQETLDPTAIMLEYEKSGRTFSLSHFFSSKRREQFVASQIDYSDSLPFDILEREYKILNGPETIINKVLREEF